MLAEGGKEKGGDGRQRHSQRPTERDLDSAGEAFPTVHFLLGNLSKDLQIRTVEDPAKDTRYTTVLGPQDPLCGHPISYKPHAEEEEEEEYILHLEAEEDVGEMTRSFPPWLQPFPEQPLPQPGLLSLP